MFTRVVRLVVPLYLTAMLLMACQPLQPVSAPEPSIEQAAVAAKIANAMSAAPPAIADEATIIDWPAESGAEPPLLRAGSNEWLCLPDNPGTPAPDPMCVDPVWTAWMNAYMAGTEPEVTALGISYMLAGGADPSNFDPHATAPAEGEEWVISPAHIMLLMPGGFDPAEFTTDHNSGGPYIMWEGTPYEHLMVPVVPAAPSTDPVAVTDSLEAKIANIMGAVPQAIGDGATFMDRPTAPGGEQAMLREGENEWLCVPDWPATPPNDPMCFDPSWTAWMGSFMAGEAPDVTILGVSYMLSGGAYADNADPSAMQPPDGQDWVVPPPHVMLIAPGGFAAADFGTDYTSGLPWIVWDETPYEFLVIPVE